MRKITRDRVTQLSLFLSVREIERDRRKGKGKERERRRVRLLADPRARIKNRDNIVANPVCFG